MCNPELQMLDDDTGRTLGCTALNRVPTETVVKHALGDPDGRHAWHMVYQVLADGRWTQAMALYEWPLYRIANLGFALEKFVDSVADVVDNGPCQQFVVTGHTTLGTFYTTDADTGRLVLKELLDTGDGAPHIQPCEHDDGTIAAGEVCPVVAYDDVLCNGGALLRTTVHAVDIAARHIAADALAILSADIGALELDFGAVLCQMTRMQAIVSGTLASGLTLMLEADKRVAKQIRQALTRTTFHVLDGTVNVVGVGLNLGFSIVQKLVVDTGNFNIETIYSAALMTLDFFAAILCQVPFGRP